MLRDNCWTSFGSGSGGVKDLCGASSIVGLGCGRRKWKTGLCARETVALWTVELDGLWNSELFGDDEPEKQYSELYSWYFESSLTRCVRSVLMRPFLVLRLCWYTIMMMRAMYATMFATSIWLIMKKWFKQNCEENLSKILNSKKVTTSRSPKKCRCFLLQKWALQSFPSILDSKTWPSHT